MKNQSQSDGRGIPNDIKMINEVKNINDHIARKEIINSIIPNLKLNKVAVCSIKRRNFQT